MQLRFAQLGYPIRKSPYHSLFPTPRSLSQVIASFIDFQTQGIHQILLLNLKVNTTLILPIIAKDKYLKVF